MIKIGKEYHWEMSHRLPFHKGGCYNIHGHSYKMMLELCGNPDENGMVLDYYEIDKIVIPILEEYDHALILDFQDEKAIKLIKELEFKYKIINTTSTSENLASHFLARFQEKFINFANIYSMTVRVYETSDAYAEVTSGIR
jgi:6-pyruvoyltetrahydropterin/6-carboxytetrahydropterin synthase